MDQNTEHDWVERAKRGEAVAVAELYRRYWRAARAAAYGVTGDFAMAEDAASEAFWAAVESLSGLRDAQRFGPWLRTIVLRTARRLKTGAAARNEAGYRPVAGAPGECAPGTRLEQSELAALVQEAVRSLPRILREAVSLFYFEGYSVEEAARFLEIPVGTVKRRLHDGRRRLQSATEQIAQGSDPMDAEREQRLQQFREAAEQGLDSEAFYQMIRQVAPLGPVPQDLVRDILKRRMAAKMAKEGPLLSPEQEEQLRAGLRRMHEPSERARDPRHPVGTAAGAIRAALPEFQVWQIDVSKIDLNAAARRLYDDRGQALSYLLPPGFIEASAGAYLTLQRSLLIEDEDGSVLTMGELLERKATRDAFHARMREGSRLSDAMDLLWKQPEPLELRTIEERLHELAEKIVPGIPVHFVPRQEPRYRAALRMQLGDSPIPAATGGVQQRWSILPEGVGVASVTLHLEPWAAARSGQDVKLPEGSAFPWYRRQEKTDPMSPSP